VLSTVLLIACVASIVVAQLFILRSALGTAVIARQDTQVPTPRRLAELAWAILPAIALGFVLWLTWHEARAAISPPPGMHEHHGHGSHAS
jgi:hypothetical protein